MFHMRNVSLFVENLTVMDFTYLHPDHGLEGESWIVDLVLEGLTDSQSMIMDFGPLKKAIKGVVDSTADHALLVPTKSPRCKVDCTAANTTHLTFEDNSGRIITHLSPASAMCLIETDAITKESVAAYLIEKIRAVVPANVAGIEVSLREEKIDGAYYHYSHGLKKHNGHCQRIAHGHRSRLEIWVDGARDEGLEAAWAAKWKHIYIGTEEDISARLTREGKEYITFAYHAGEGAFELTLAAECCDVMPQDSTVECIAQHIADTLKAQNPKHHYRVKAFEGVGKGAVALA